MSHDSKFIFYERISNEISLWSTETQKELENRFVHDNSVVEVLVTKDNKYIFTGTDNGILYKWGLQDMQIKIKV